MIKKLLLISSFLFATNAFAETRYITAVPTGWMLTNYPGDRVHAFKTTSSCVQENLSFPANATNRDKDRFWSLIMSAKIAKKSVRIEYNYDAAAATCLLISYSLAAET